MIKLESLNKYFNKGKSNEIHVIHDTTYEFPDHGMVALFGRSGCGKTTLLNVIGGLDVAQSGSIFIEGQKMSASMDELRNKYIGYIFQNYCLNMTDSCYDNVAMALKLCGMRDEEEIRPRVLKALDVVGMKKFENRTPDTLSGGQQQRIAIARALVKNAPIILADEPTGNLDEANTVLIMDILKQISKEHLVLLVTHEEKLVDYYCDTVIELSDGKIVGTRENNLSGGYIARKNNVIYLGEYEKSEISSDMLQLSYYGQKPEEPVKARLINHNGVLYLKVDSASVHVIDETSEVKLEEGTFEERLKSAESGDSIDLSELTSFEGRQYGKLYTFKDGIKSGLQIMHDRMRKKSAKRLRRVLVLLGMISVFMISSSCVNIKKFLDMKREAATDFVFIDQVGDDQNKLKAISKNKEDYGIRSMIFLTSWRYDENGGLPVTFNIGAFETYSSFDLFNNGDNKMVLYPLPLSDLGNAKLIAGNQITGMEEALISKKLADEILDNSKFRFMKSYDDLIGLSFGDEALLQKESNTYHFKAESEYWESDIYNEPWQEYSRDDNTGEITVKVTNPALLRICGVVDSDEKVAYFDDAIFKLDKQGKYTSYLRNEMSVDHFAYKVWVHCSDVDKCVKALRDSGFDNVSSYKERYEKELADMKIYMLSEFTSVIIWSLLVCLCMFFIMRSVFLGRVKELGIARAIGTSRKNLLYKTYVETGVMSCFTVIIGYLIATIGIQYLQVYSKQASTWFFYPWYLKIAMFLFLLIISILSGSISAFLILRKTPAQILAKYDI